MIETMAVLFAFLIVANTQYAFSQEEMDAVDTIIYCGSLEDNEKKTGLF
ncbi:hypothetical protein JCM17846_31770 [Iodidimonas nitroreducens]|uniref:Uncharacterized protein n=1 Tax=Iodidimonas nitroreducens TaxID=1236968 RepID=A0A5A7NCY7_9PROT|nr:hypothetical protein JCM17846_31770 [Iodidimonas nitroreducens]